MFYIILSGNSHTFSKPANKQRLSFSTRKHDVCFGHQVPQLIPDYTLEMYLNTYGNEVIDTFKRNKDYELIPIRMTIAESISQWNYGAKEWLNKQPA